MAASRLLSLLRTSHNLPSSTLRRNLLYPLNSRNCCSSALTLDSDDNCTPVHNHFSSISGHPWLEWLSFLDRLLVKDYNSSGGGVYSSGNQYQSGFGGSGGDDMKPGDWICPTCNFMNFSRNVKCRECNAEGPKRPTLNVEKKLGDWDCPRCGFLNYASRTQCLRCRDPRQLNSGEWECPTCHIVNSDGVTACRKCNGQAP